MNSHTPTFRDEGFEERPRHERTYEPAHQREPAHERPHGAGAARIIASTDLFRGAHEVVIDHAGAHYRLKITRQGKLILNK